MYFKIWLFVLVPSLVSLPMAFAGSIRGRIVDSITGEALEGVRVYSETPECSTSSDVNGEFELIVPATGTFQPEIPRIVASPDISRVVSLNGRVISKRQMPAGNYLAVINGSVKKILFLSQSNSSKQRPASTMRLAKQAASSPMELSFSKDGYLPLIKKATEEQVNLGEILMSPEVVNDSAAVGNFIVRLGEAGTVEVDAVIAPNPDVEVIKE